MGGWLDIGQSGHEVFDFESLQGDVKPSLNNV